MSKQNNNNATCIICGKEYHLCIGCDRTKTNWKSWKMITDTENCYNIYKVLNDYGYNKISKDEARELLKKLDLSDIDNFRDGVKNRIKDIIKVNTTFKKKNKYKRNHYMNDVADNVENEINVQEVVQESMDKENDNNVIVNESVDI